MKKKLLIAAAIAAAFVGPAEAESIELKIHNACARYAPFSVAQWSKCTQILIGDNEQFLEQVETSAGKRIMADCEKLEISEQLGRYVELRMCFRKGYKDELRAQAEEKRAQEVVRLIIADIPAEPNARRMLAKQCMPDLAQVTNYRAALACLNENGAADTPPSGHIDRLREAMLESGGNIKPFKIENFLKSLGQ